MAEAKRFRELDKLVEALLNERNSGAEGRFCVRLVLLPDFRHLKSFRTLIRNRKVKEVFLEDKVEDNLRWLYPEKLADIVKEASLEGSTIVLHSVSEAIRFYAEEELYDLILNKLLLIEGGRVIIPLAGMSERILDIYKNFPRKGEYTPLYTLEGDGKKLLLYLINPELRLPFEPVASLKKLLSLWMNTKKREEFVAIKSFYTRAENARPDSAVESVRINSYEELLRKAFGFSEHINFKDDKFLQFLTAEVHRVQAGNFSDLLASRTPGSFKEFLGLYFSEKDENIRKLLINYAHSRWREFREVLDNDPYKLAQNLWLSRFSKSEKKEYIRKIVEVDHSMDRGLCESIGETINKHNLLGVLSCERIKAIELFAKGDISEEELRGVWKGFDFYLDTPVPSNLSSELGIIHEYIKEYKLCKLRDRISDRLRELLGELNSSEERFYEWYHRIDELGDLIEQGIRVIQLDGVGFEWAGFIAGVLKERGLPVEDIKVARANLPTITETNKLEGATAIGEFDTFIHHGKNSYPEYIVEKMERLYQILIKEIELSGGRLIITADHGATALSRKEEALGFNTKGEGIRFMIGKADIPETLVFKGDKLYTIALTHRSISKKPAGETHGGATPEEILIPFIVVGRDEVSYRLELEKEELTSRMLRFKLFPEPTIPVRAKLEGAFSYELEVRKKGDWFIAELPINTRAGSYSLKVYVGSREVSKEITVKGGMEEKDLL